MSLPKVESELVRSTCSLGSYVIYKRGDYLILQWEDGETSAQQIPWGSSVIELANDWSKELNLAN